MHAWTHERLKNQRFSRSRRAEAQRQELKVHQSDHTVSWAVYDKGVANTTISAALDPDGIPHIEITVSETKLAEKNFDAKRDVEKSASHTLYGPAALELFEMLREVFEPVEPAKA